MTTEHEQQIRELAHHIWESEGCPKGEEMRHWHMAERLLAASATASTNAPLTRGSKKSTRAAARPARRQRGLAPKGKTP